MDKDLGIIYGVWIFVVVSLMLIPLISSSPVLTDNLISYYKFDETSGTTAYDSTGSHNATNTGISINQGGKIGTAYTSTSTSQKVSIPLDLIDLYSDFTVSLWFNSISSVDVRGLWGNDLSGSNTISVDAGSGFNDGDWHFAVATYSSGNIELFIDNVSKGTSSGSCGSISLIYGYPASGHLLLLCQSGDGGTGTTALFLYAPAASNTWIGTIDEVGIWNRVLTVSEISKLWNGGDGNTYPFVVDTCTCPGTGNNWEIDMSDYCNITEACDLTTGTLSFTGSGITRLNSTIKTTNLGDPGSSGVLYIQDSCLIEVS